MTQGHFYIAFGTEYDNVAYHSCKRLRQFSKLPIHVVSNLTEETRVPSWKEIDNVTFNYLPLPDIHNREVKTSAVFYSPFEMTLYTDADTLIHSNRFMEVFTMLERTDLVLSVYQDNVRYPKIPKYQAPAFLKVLEECPTPAFNKKTVFTLYNGPIFAFKRSSAVTMFFKLFRTYWEKTGRLRDMPPLSMAAAEMKGTHRMPIGHLGEAYGKVKSSIIQSCHDLSVDYKYLPKFTRYHPDIVTGKWVYKTPK